MRRAVSQLVRRVGTASAACSAVRRVGTDSEDIVEETGHGDSLDTAVRRHGMHAGPTGQSV